MQIFIVFLLGFSCGAIFVTGKLVEINGKQCEFIFCPKNCTLTFRDGCPHNCNCGPPPVCPRVECPYPFPRCIIFTQRDGCQSCACQQPALVLAESNGKRVLLVRTEPPPSQGRSIKTTRVAIEPLNTLITTSSGRVVFNSSSQTIEKVKPERRRLGDLPLVDELPEGVAVTEANGVTILNVGEDQIRIHSKLLFNKTLKARPPLALHGGRGSCKKKNIESIDAAFEDIYREMDIRREFGSITFPVAFSYNRHELNTACYTFDAALDKISGRDMRLCRNNYPIFDEVIANFAYPCGYATKSSFFRYFDCFGQVKTTGEAELCDRTARARLADQFLNKCDVYESMSECVEVPIRRQCGNQAYEIFFQFLKLNVKQHVKGCVLTQRSNNK